MIEGLIYKEAFIGKWEEQQILEEIEQNHWSTELKRRVQHYGYKYDYKLRKIGKESYIGPLPHFSEWISGRLLVQQLINRVPDQLIVNEYMPGQGISKHIDCVPCFKETIVTISLGWAYEMQFQNIVSGEIMNKVLDVGSVLVLSGPARYGWTHEIKSRKDDNGIPRQRRVSLTFRNVIV